MSQYSTATGVLGANGMPSFPCMHIKTHMTLVARARGGPYGMHATAQLPGIGGPLHVIFLQ
jgi:hypothetical protein